MDLVDSGSGCLSETSEQEQAMRYCVVLKMTSLAGEAVECNFNTAKGFV